MSLPIRWRLTIWYVAVLAFLIAAFSAFLLIRLREDLTSGIDAALASTVAQITQSREPGVEGETVDIGEALLTQLQQGERGAQILDASGTVEQTSGDPAARLPMIDRATVSRILASGPASLTRDLNPDSETFRIRAVALGPNDVLVVAMSLDGVGTSVHRLLLLLLVAGPVVVAAAALGGWWLARQALTPVAQMTLQAESVGIDRMDERIVVPRVQDELAALARTINGMLDRLERGVQDKRRFLADAAHELRTPLAVMRSEIDVALRGAPLDPGARDVLESTSQEIERMARIVDDLLILARIDEGKLQLLYADVDLAQIAGLVVSSLQSLAENADVSLEMEGPEARLVADQDRLRQVVVNLVDNAIAHTPPGGRVRVGVAASGNEVRLSVADSGPGIPTESLPHVFDRFFREDPARARARSGAGLGLAICREIVEAHGGRIWVESRTGEGCMFTLLLPTHGGSPLQAVPPARAARSPV